LAACVKWNKRTFEEAELVHALFLGFDNPSSADFIV